MKYINLLVLLLLFASCSGQDKKTKQNDTTEALTRMNRAHVGQESKIIDAFVAQKKFNVQRTGTGLRYEIYKNGTGAKPVAHDLIELKYKVYLLNGQLCYSSDSTGNTKFRIGEGKQIRGLEEGVMLMQQGDKAHLILPNHLAFGMIGDNNKIPPGQPVYFDIELISIKK